MTAPVQITGSGGSWRIVQGGRVLGHARGQAATVLLAAERRAATATLRPRPCLCCGARINSTGPGHRLCRTCREG